MPSEAMAQGWMVAASSAATSTTAAISRSVTMIWSVEGNTRLTVTSFTQASRSMDRSMAPGSTVSRVVPCGMEARAAMSWLVRCSAPMTSTFSMVKAGDR